MYMRERQRDPQAWLNKLVLSSVKVVIFVWGKFTLVKWVSLKITENTTAHMVKKLKL